MVGFGVSLNRPQHRDKNLDKKVHVILEGGLGEQLFQCAMGVALSIEMNLKLECSLGEDVKRGFFQNYLNLISQGGPIRCNRDIQYEKDTPVPRDKKYDPKQLPLIFSGKYQSEKHFKNHRHKIVQLFRLPEKFVQKTNKNYKKRVEKSPLKVSVRINRHEYGRPYISLDYYERAIAKFNSKYLFVVITDDVDWCRNIDLFKLLPNVMFVTNETDYTNMYLESVCDHHILSNHLDSWWAAYLGTGSRTRVICPSIWCYNDKDFDKELIPKNWVCM